MYLKYFQRPLCHMTAWNTFKPLWVASISRQCDYVMPHGRLYTIKFASYWCISQRPKVTIKATYGSPIIKISSNTSKIIVIIAGIIPKSVLKFIFWNIKFTNFSHFEPFSFGGHTQYNLLHIDASLRGPKWPSKPYMVLRSSKYLQTHPKLL